MLDSARILTNVYDGNRRPVADVQWVVRLSDGRALQHRQTHTYAGLSGPSKLFEVPFFDNPFDDYTGSGVGGAAISIRASWLSTQLNPARASVTMARCIDSSGSQSSNTRSERNQDGS